MKEYKCLNPECGNTWLPRTKKKPKLCPQCKTRYWDNKQHWEKKSQRKKEIQ